MPAFIDSPASEITEPRVLVMGWVAGDGPNVPVTLSVNGASVPFTLHERPDVREALRAFPYTSGIFAAIDLRRVRHDGTLLIELQCGPDKEKRQLTIANRVRALEKEDAALQQASRAFCLKHLRCSHCGADTKRLRVGKDVIVCTACKAEFRQSHSAINMISENLRIQSNITPTDNVSSNPYPPDSSGLIERVTARGGWVLDCGAGSRDRRLPNVVNVEIVDYVSTDALAVGESLPFRDNTFDGALSLAVLEHVRDPFKCAKELLRVVKPGGEIIADVPFLQPVHGYPHHYYNMTALGLKNLFDGAEILDCHVPLHGHPIFAVNWLLREYVAGLPGESRAHFQSMTVAQLCSIDLHKFLTQPAAHNLSAEAQSVIACLNTIHLKKR